ncbi:MAG: class II aldolase/adducin family protein [Actinobacteria bacterium]|nr:class II aldolase/adducin family protein [Actinomycetota bacterium]MCL5447078.1 class II aldolase/adducin family protein [Actinomycetota bacterium]
MYRKDMVQGTQGNVSARLPDGNICITPSSISYEEMALDDLVTIAPDGAVLDGGRSPSSEKLLHMECYKRFPDIASVVHSHPVYASMFALTGKSVPAWMDETIIYLGGDIEVSAYGMSGTQAMATNAAMVLEGRNVALLANHGMVSVGKSPSHALELAILAERTAHIVLGATLLGSLQPLPRDSADSLKEVYRLMRSMG